jgi:hypothetical protein
MENKHKTAVSSISKYYDSLFTQYYIYNSYLYIFSKIFLSFEETHQKYNINFKCKAYEFNFGTCDMHTTCGLEFNMLAVENSISSVRKLLGLASDKQDLNHKKS